MSDSNATIPRVRLTVASIEGNVGEYLSLDLLRTVNGVFDEMLSRLYYGAEKRKGWEAKEPWQELTEDECRSCVRNALVKGNLIDAMNYIMFTHLNGFSLTTLRQQTVDEPVSIDSQMRDQLANALGITGRNWDEMLDHVVKMRKGADEQTDALAQIAAALRMGPETPPKHLANIVESQNSRQYAVTEDKTRKTALPNDMAAPYGVKASKKRQQYELTMDVDNSGIASPLFIFRSKKDRDDYLPLLRTFLGALEQAAYGKGRERHANDLPFIEQPILTMAQMLGSDAGLAQQVIKKTVEARSLPTKQARINELRGTLVYAATMILFEEMYGAECEPFEDFDL